MSRIPAATLMEKFIEDGHYPELKKTEGTLKTLTNSIKTALESSESKRHVFEKWNLVGRFTAKKIYNVDYIGLNEYLYDVGLLLQVAEIDNNAIKTNELYHDMIQDFRLPETFYVKPNFNKAGKELIKSDFEIPDYWGINEAAQHIGQLKPRAKELAHQYEGLKSKLLHLIEKDQQKSIKQPIPHKYGSLSWVANQPKYDISAIYDYLGEGLLIEYGKPNSKLLEHYILNGMLSERDIEPFKTVKDIRLDFSVMTLEDEEKFLTMMDIKKQISAANRVGA
ncbi:hypothetical protein [Cytobacillus firmus]|uniref:Uncharacterized protein n=1 Tax=Cytobacillus firmus TaxID=1399 RepID=A0AA46PMW6_CYTFI|nr:hypothetical protein [Cytobacillus firmus]UYG98218.1 hypothetical protein OD459_25445 [Cytobacillus firmus]